MRSLEPTREGKRFLIASSLIAVAAFNTGNNLIYLIFSLMLSFLVLSVVLARMNMSGLSLDVGDGQAVFAGEETSLTLLLKNGKSLIPSYSVKCWVTGSHVPAYYDVIPALKDAERDVRISFQKRGLYRCADFRVESGFPFILLNARKKINVSGSLLVYPFLVDVSAGINQIVATGAAEALSAADAGDDLYALRKFREGDDWRRIHWKASAKRQVYFVKEYAEYRGLKVTIILDNRLPEGGELFEKAVSLAASLAKDFIARGYYVSLVTCRETVLFGNGGEHLLNILDVLALVAEEGSWDNELEESADELLVAVLKDRASPGGGYVPVGSMVFYAEDI